MPILYVLALLASNVDAERLFSNEGIIKNKTEEQDDTIHTYSATASNLKPELEGCVSVSPTTEMIDPPKSLSRSKIIIIIINVYTNISLACSD